MSACDSTACLLQTRGGEGLPGKGRWQLDLSWRYSEVTEGREGRAFDDVRRPWVDFEGQTVWPSFHREAAGSERFLQFDIVYGMGQRWAARLSVPLHTRPRLQHRPRRRGLRL